MRCLLLFYTILGTVTALWPLPLNQALGNSSLWIDQDVQFTYQGRSQNSSYSQSLQSNTTSAASAASSIVDFAIKRTRTVLFKHSFVPWKFHPRNSDFEPPIANKTCIRSITLTLLANDPASVLKPLDGAVDESYSLTVSATGETFIASNSSIGLARGLTTFTQLFYKHSRGGVYTPYAPVKITDAPKFVHRGLNMDVARNFFPVKDILRTIDALAYTKMNRLHLHITDSQSWPLEIPSLPDLAKKGAYRRDLTYSPKELAAIQSYGAQQGVEVYLEIDMPGHTSSIWYAYPDLIAAFNRQPNWDTYAAEPPSGTLKLNSSAVANFTQVLFDDLMPRVAPFSSYFHTGGDEVNANAYKLDDTLETNDPTVIQPYMQRFVDRNHGNVRKYGLTPIVWEEMLLVWNLTLGEDVLVQTWQSDEAVAEVVGKGHKALVGNYNYWYLDCGKGQWLNFNQGASSQQFWPYLDYCNPYKNWRLVYSYDPLHGVPANATHLVQGGECHIWAEQTDPVNFDRVVWPRAAAAAEVLWSGAKDEHGQNRSQVLAAPRLSEFRERLVAMGVAADVIQMPFCLMGEGQCSL